jgi:hypothetical protein
LENKNIGQRKTQDKPKKKPKRKFYSLLLTSTPNSHLASVLYQRVC